MNRKIDRALAKSIYARELAAGQHGAITRTMNALHAQGIACVYGTVRSIVSGKQDRWFARKTGSRFAPTDITAMPARLPAIDSRAMRDMRTVYPHTVVPVDTAPVLKSGHNSPKIGKVVLKGRWRGMPIYTLTLEERATCPFSCRHFRSCYGNQMNWAVRYQHGDNFEQRLIRNVLDLGRKHPDGFVVRLHVLGDFYSVRYVRVWWSLLELVPPLHVFGYTARWDDEIGQELRLLVGLAGERFAIRFSNAPHHGVAWDMPATVSIELPMQRPADAFVCPEQANKTESCGTCGACWSTKKRVCFIQH